MIFHRTKLPGASLIELEKKEDSRGFFARAYCAKEFAEHGLNSEFVQASLSFTSKKGTIRGMHYQVPPAAESKCIRCIRGAVWDVIVDMRVDSPTYLEHICVELSSDNRRAIFVPEMFAHGHQSMTDDAELLYLISAFHTPGCERGIRFDDPALGIQWPLPVSVISDKDAAWPRFEPERRSAS